MANGLTFNKVMGFAINGMAVPDPATFGYKSQSEDTAANRDTKGRLHRKMVATKYNVSVSWSGLDYKTASDILIAVRAPKFTFTFPCPEIPRTENNGLHTGEYYTGDRSVDTLKAGDKEDMDDWIVSMAFDCIEY